MTIELNRMASFLFDPEGGKLIAATQEAKAESAINREFLSRAAGIGTEANVSKNIPLTLQH